MSASKQLFPGLLLAGCLAACGPMLVEPELTISASPRTLDGVAQKATIKVVGVDDKAKPGTGKVRITSVAGSLKDGVEVDLLAGEGSTDFTCARATEPACTGTVRLNAEWVVSGKLTSASTSITITPAVVDAGTDAGFDAGVDAGFDAGQPIDAGVAFTLTTDKNQIIAGVGDSAVLTATLRALGQPVPNQPLTFTTTVGRLGPVGGSAVGPSYLASTDDAGVVLAQLIAGATDMGQASVTARVDGGTSLPVTINIVNVSQIGYVSTECPQTTTNCNLMGLQGSGFNETALVKFKVTDGAGAGVSGVRVDFSLINAPAGTSVDPTAMTNALGEVRANVRAGTTIGTFSVTANALSMFSVTSPTIGVRGAKASNRGFTLRCDRVNQPAFAAVTPPLPLTVSCQVGLSDRYLNPIGTGTQVRLNSEAGVVPNNVSTTPFMPNGTNEGLGQFTFNTILNFPPLDVAPFPADPAQYPMARAAEPSIPGTVTRNPRDGLVTIIAYLQGEEDFKDDNSNGVRDSNEQFIDQGEPFVDANDNNAWDTGETFVDTPPSDGGVANGQWDGPNGTWDSNAQIWTEYRLLYTGVSNGPASMLTFLSTRSGGGSYGTLLNNTTRLMSVFVPDANLNRVEGGSGLTARFSPATRGQIAIVNNTSGLDGYGFELQRLLVNAAGTGPCTTSELVCRWKIILGSWSEGYLADVQLTGAAPPAMPAAQTAIVDVTVRSVTNSAAATGIVE